MNLTQSEVLLTCKLFAFVAELGLRICYQFYQVCVPGLQPGDVNDF